MIVYCEECGAKNNIKKLSREKQREGIRCQYCNDILVIHNEIPDDISQEPEKPILLSRLILKYQDQIIEHEGPDHQITIGRQEGNDIRVVDERVSRLHAVVVYKQGKYCLIDQSLNGTYILIRNRHGRTIKHKEIMLISQGVIGVTGAVDEKSPNAILYSIHSPGATTRTIS